MRRIRYELAFAIVVCFSLSCVHDKIQKEIKHLQDQITGAVEFSVESPRLNGIEVSVADFGASPSASGVKNVMAFEKAIAKLKEKGATKLTIPSGIYYLNDERRDQILLDSIEDLLIEGNGSELIFGEHDTSVSGSFIRICHSNRVKIQNLTLDWDWDRYPLFVIGKITEMNREKKEVEFEIEHFDVPEQLMFGGGRPWDPAINNRDGDIGFSFPGGASDVSAIRKTGDRRITLTFAKLKSLDKAFIGQYGQIYLKPQMNANAINSRDNKNLILDNLTIYSAPYLAINTYGIENFQIINSKVIPRPGSHRRFSTYGGFETHSVIRNFWIENSVMDGVQDDHIHLSNGYIGGGVERIDSQVLKCGFLQKFQTDALIYEGACLALYNQYFMEKGWSSKVVSFRWEPNTYPSRNSDGLVIVFEDPLPDNLDKDDILYNTGMFDGNFIIRNNIFKNGLCHGLYVGLANGTIEGNYFDNFGYPSLIVNTVRRWGRWFIGNPVSNVIIRNNVMKNNNTDRRDPATLFVGAGIDSAPSDYKPVPSIVVSNILIENNTVENSTWAAFATFSAHHVIVRNNQFINSNQKPSKKRFEGKGNVFVTNADHIYLINNTILNSKKAFEEGIFIEDSTTHCIQIIRHTLN